MRPGGFPKYLQSLFANGASGDHADGRLLEQFVSTRDEVAFEILVARHGPMILRVCRAALANPHDVDDAFQATFFVLLRNASTIRSHDSIASWLYGVASRVAARVKVDAARRGKHERMAAASRPSIEMTPKDEASAFLIDEVKKLPSRYREAIVLCYFEGQSCDAAASQLRRPVNTVKSHLIRGRTLLKEKLVRRGITMPLGLTLAGVTSEAAASIPPSLLRLTVSSASRYSAGIALPSALATILAEGVLKSMLFNKLAYALLLVTSLTAGALALTQGPVTEKPPARPAQPVSVSIPVPDDSAVAQLKSVLSGDLPSDPYMMTFALIGLARAQYDAGDRDAALATLRVAGEVATKVQSEHLRRLAIMRTAVARGKAGDSVPAHDAILRIAEEGRRLSGAARYDLMSMVIAFLQDAGFKQEARANLDAELKIVDAIEDERIKDGGIYRFLYNQVHLGDFDGALDHAKKFTGEKSNIGASYIQTILNHKMYKGVSPSLANVRRALELSHAVTYPYPRCMAEADIAAALARCGDIEGGLSVARDIDKDDRSDFEIRGAMIPKALTEIAQVQAKVGQVEAAKATLLEAIEVVRTLRQKDVIYAERLRRIAEAQAGMGEIEAARTTVRFIDDDQVEAATALIAVARAQFKAGDAAAARVTLSEALVAAKGIKVRKNLIGDNPTSNTNGVINQIAVAQAETGDVAGALESIVSHGDDAWKSEARAAIIPAQARSGDVEGALATAGLLAKPAPAYAAIARAQALAGDIKGAMRWTARLDGAAKPFAIIGINEALATLKAEKRAKGTP